MKRFGFHYQAGAGTIRVFYFPLGWAGSWTYGTWWIGAGRYRLILKAPWNEPLFSERYGGRRFLPLCGGWRIRFQRNT